MARMVDADPATERARRALRDRLAATCRARQRLAERRDELTFALLDAHAAYREDRAALAAAFDRASLASDRAVVREGRSTVADRAEAVTATPTVTLGESTLAGVDVRTVEAEGVRTPLTERGYAVLDSSAAIDDAADAHERLLLVVCRVAEREAALRALAVEVGRLDRRLRAITQHRIPRLGARLDDVERRLADSDGADRHRRGRRDRRLTRGNTRGGGRPLARERLDVPSRGSRASRLASQRSPTRSRPRDAAED
jgi:V/A-type H+-transporting ATPase subunit D